MFDLLFSSMPKLALLGVFFWYLVIARRSIRLEAGKSSALRDQLDLFAEVERSGRLVAALAERQDARLRRLEERRTETGAQPDARS